MRFFKRGDTADSEFIFIDGSTNQPIDVNNPTYKIVHYDGPTEVEDVASTTLPKVTGETGVYVATWDIPLSVPDNETYFVRAEGDHPIEGTTTTLEDFYRVVPDSYFNGGSGSGTGLVAKFTKP